MRKGTVFIISKDINEVLDYIISKIPNDIKFNIRKELYNGGYTLTFNDYEILIRNNIYMNARGYRPEIIYIIQGVEVSDDIYENIVMAKTFLSTRKEPIRKIKFVEDIDVGEFLYDDHAELIYCDKDKLQRWTDIMSPKEIDTEKWKREYECTWFRKEEN